MVSSFVLVTRTCVPIDELFDASLSIDEHVESMARSGERAVDGVTGGSIALGESVTWRARHFGVWFRMTVRITSLERPVRFVDEQTRGPFRSFRHEHVFRTEGETTVMVDTVTIASPVFGRLAERAVLVPYLRRLIRGRNHHLVASRDAAALTRPGSVAWPIDEALPFRRAESTVFLGRGDDVWQRAARDVLTWKVKTRSGFTVDDDRPVRAGRETTVVARVVGITVREPVRVASVVESDSRVGFAYVALAGHPVSGEEAFIVHREGADVYFTVRSLTAAAKSQPWRALHPLLRVAQIMARRRYLRALR